MTQTFTIDPENNITALSSVPAGADESTIFRTAKDLAKLAETWSANRLVEIWNGFAGVAPFDDLEPVKRFKHRRAAIDRIWKAIQRLAPRASDLPAKRSSKSRDGATTPPTPKKRNVARVSANTPRITVRADSKQATVIALLNRPGGVTAAEIAALTGWQPHTIRGFISGTVCKKLAMQVESFKSEAGRSYRIIAGGSK